MGATVLLMLLPKSAAVAQSTLFNIPSTDVVAEKKTYVEFDFISHLEAHKNGGFQAYVPRVVYGIAKKWEVGANVVVTDALAPDQPVELQPNVKYQFYANEKQGCKQRPVRCFTRLSRIGRESILLACSIARSVRSGRVPMDHD